jgi:[ribosomal protein S5]-alanine N-acetyltransferase
MASQFRLETDRFILRPPLKKDIPTIVKELNQKAISDTTLHIPYPYSKKDAMIWVTKNKQEIVKGSSYTFAIIHKKTNQMIGAIGLHLNDEHNRAEVGYWIAVSHWNKGVATEALIRILEFGFDKVGINKIFATHLVDNPSSGRVMLKAGMIREGKLNEHYRKGEEYITVIQYGMTASANEKWKRKQTKMT